MKPKSVGWALLTALGYGPVLFALLIALHLNGAGFSFTTHAMCSLAVGQPLYRALFFAAAWGMAALHLPFLIQWPGIAESMGGNRRGRVLFPACAVIAVIPWLNLRTGKHASWMFPAASLLWMVASLAYAVPFTVYAQSAPPYPGWINLLNWVFLICYAPWALLYGMVVIRTKPFVQQRSRQT